MEGRTGKINIIGNYDEFYCEFIPKLAIVVLGVHYEPLNSNQP